MPRSDISPNVIHFTKSAGDKDAFEVLRTIVSEGVLLGGTGNIRGGHQCVCFTESPLQGVAAGLVNHHGYIRYSPYGLMFEKTHVFAAGGRPVIYGTDEEYEQLPPGQNWRHVRYEPIGDSPIDFTWEREWRLLKREFPFDPSNARLVVPNSAALERLIAEHEGVQDFQVQLYSQVMEQNMAEQYRVTYPWRVVVLDE